MGVGKTRLRHTSKAPNWGVKDMRRCGDRIPCWGLHFKRLYTLFSSIKRDIQNGKGHKNNDQTLKTLKMGF